VQLAMIGLGKMGANMTTRLLRGGHRVVAYDVNEQALTSPSPFMPEANKKLRTHKLVL
jgi:6-phosphogluconate dehydrogenase (decarboxylating)